jgi:hypothetical protein
MKPDTDLEMAFQLPRLIAGKPAAWVVCKGRILRLSSSREPECQFSYVVGITRYAIKVRKRFLRVT